MPYADRTQQREYQRLWILKRRNDWLLGKSCIDCGATDLLEIDHVDQKQKITHRIWSWSAARRESELAKCVVRCRTCHHKKTTHMGEIAHGERVRGANDASLVQRIRQQRVVMQTPYRQLAKEYGLALSTVWYMVNRHWKHLPR